MQISQVIKYTYHLHKFLTGAFIYYENVQLSVYVAQNFIPISQIVIYLMSHSVNS